MVLAPQPYIDAYEGVNKVGNSITIMMTPQGEPFTHETSKELAKYDQVIILCGHYEGLDERIIELCIDEEVSIGDYVLTGGELPAMVMVEAVCRYVDGVIAKESLSEESFSEGLLEYPQYTRPQEFMGLKVPEVLLSGHHAQIEKWRKEKSLEITKRNRPDLLEKGDE